MCDLIPANIWNDIDSTFLEPTCGNGNFLVEILERKLKLCKEPKDIARALKSIYAIDIMQDNVDESRKRLIELCSAKCVEFTNDYSQIADVMVDCLEILQNNIVCGDSLEIMKNMELNEGKITKNVYNINNDNQKEKLLCQTKNKHKK